MNAILAAIADTASDAALLSGGTPVSALTLFPQYNPRLSNSPKSNAYGSSFGSSFDQPRRSITGWGNSSASYSG
jgi:hypothetical protein